MMERPQITIHNAATGESVTREMNDAEFTQWQADVKAAEERETAQAAAIAAKAAARASALAKLAALGLTEEEAAAIIK